ncbi:hypothetical protein AGMMS49982_00860 [Bacteroidia bacterium]|nr:hypothetical protein AGMMS49982_00860 [Bacteroidia bacterium]
MFARVSWLNVKKQNCFHIIFLAYFENADFQKKYVTLQLKKQQVMKTKFLLTMASLLLAANSFAKVDSHLQHSFYVLISKEKLISKYLPGEYRGLFLYRKNAL